MTQSPYDGHKAVEDSEVADDCAKEAAGNIANAVENQCLREASFARLPDVSSETKTWGAKCCISNHVTAEEATTTQNKGKGEAGQNKGKRRQSPHRPPEAYSSIPSPPLAPGCPSASPLSSVTGPSVGSASGGADAPCSLRLGEGDLHPFADWRASFFTGQTLSWERCDPAQFLHLVAACAHA